MTRRGERETLRPELAWTGERFERDVSVVVEGGRIAAIERAGTDPAAAGAALRDLGRRALLPGFVNAHSHAFQRGLRGAGEHFPAGSSSFWGWREAMYGLVDGMDEERLFALSSQAFREMLASGITTVGEFHYLHHDRRREGYAFDPVVLQAAAQVGIRIVLLSAFYKEGGIGKPLSAAQERFRSRSPEEYWEAFDALAERLDPATQTLGAVVHSVRAAGLDDLVSVHAESVRRGLPFHMHLEEQRLEIEDCRSAYGATPMALLNERLQFDERFCAVHCTHTEPSDMERFLAAGGNVCICPLTEANLGDGIPELGSAFVDGALSLGTDSNARISFPEEMRWLEYGQRLRSEGRGVLRDREGQVARVALAAATSGGARALGLDCGALRVGAWADFLTLDLDAPALAGWEDGSLLDAFVFGAGTEVISEVCVGGRWTEARGPAR